MQLKKNKTFFFKKKKNPRNTIWGGMFLGGVPRAEQVGGFGKLCGWLGVGVEQRITLETAICFSFGNLFF